MFFWALNLLHKSNFKVTLYLHWEAWEVRNQLPKTFYFLPCQELKAISETPIFPFRFQQLLRDVNVPPELSFVCSDKSGVVILWGSWKLCHSQMDTETRMQADRQSGSWLVAVVVAGHVPGNTLRHSVSKNHPGLETDDFHLLLWWVKKTTTLCSSSLSLSLSLRMETTSDDIELW